MTSLLHRNATLCSIALVGVALLLAAGPARAEGTVDPGGTLSDLDADEGSTTCLESDATCDAMVLLDQNAVQLLIDVGSDESSEQSVQISSAFTVSEGEGVAAESPLLNSIVSLDVFIEGLLEAVLETSSASYRVQVEVRDRTAGDALVANQTVSQEETGAGLLDVGSRESLVLNVPLTRGHTYDVILVLSATAMGATDGSALVDFFNAGGLVGWESLTVMAGADPFGAIAMLSSRVDGLDRRLTKVEGDVAGLQEEVEDIQSDVRKLTRRVKALEDDVEEIDRTLERLIEAFRVHTHTYLTGRGNGHNNTIATTTAPSGAMPPRDPGEHGDEPKYDSAPPPDEPKDEKDEKPGNGKTNGNGNANGNAKSDEVADDATKEGEPQFTSSNRRRRGGEEEEEEEESRSPRRRR